MAKINKKSINRKNKVAKKGVPEKYFLYIYLVILSITFFKVYSDIYDEKIYLGGDNAGYYILGNAIASGQGYTNIHTIQKTSHNHFPPGYPIIIATASKLYSNDISFVKKVNGLFLFFSIVLLFFVIYKISGNYHIAFISSLFSLLNFHLLSYSTIMMSEIPFMFFSLLSVWLLLKLDFSKAFYKNWVFYALIICVAFTYHIRSTGLALLFGIALYFAIEKKWSYMVSFIAGFITLGLPWYIRGQSIGGNAYVKQLLLKNPYRPELGKMEFFDWFERFWANFSRYITREIPSGTFNFIEFSEDPLTQIAASEWIIGLLLLAVMIFGLFQIKRYFYLLLSYIVASFGILLLWPAVWFGVRFMLPLIPIFTFLFVVGVYNLLSLFSEKVLKIHNQTIISIGIVVLSLIATQSYSKQLDLLHRQAKGKFTSNYKNYFEIAKWAGSNTSDTAVVCCRKGQLFHLYSNRYVAGFKNSLDKEEIIQDFIDKGVTHIVLDNLGYSANQRYLQPAIDRYPLKFKLMKRLNDPDTHLLRFYPERGYWGEWKDDKKNGFGSFTDANGITYVGQWENNMTHGKGKYYQKDGSYLDGTWTNGKLNGVVYHCSPGGDTLEHRFYKDNKKITKAEAKE